MENVNRSVRREGSGGARKREVETGTPFPDRVERGVAGASVESVVVETVELGGDEGSGGVENERHGSGVVRGVAKEDADSGSVLPFVVGML